MPPGLMRLMLMATAEHPVPAEEMFKLSEAFRRLDADVRRRRFRR